MMNKHLFKAGGRRAAETNTEKPLSVPAGLDSFEAILKSTPGTARYTDFVSSSGVTEGAYALWQQHIVELCSAPTLDDPAPAAAAAAATAVKSSSEGDAKSEQEGAGSYPEPAVDEMRAQRE
jgi:hypothetical protein